MAIVKEWYSVQELAGLPGLAATVRGIQKWAEKNLAASRLKARGKGREYALKSLPAETQAHLTAAALAEAFACVPAILTPAAVGTALVAQSGATQLIAASAQTAGATGLFGLEKISAHHVESAYQTNTQRAVGDARQAVLRAVQRLQDDAGVTPRAAALSFLTQAKAGRLTGDVASAMLTLAKDNRGRKARGNPAGAHATAHAGSLPSLRTLQLWMARKEISITGDNLAPVIRQADMALRPWMVLAVELKRRPQKPPTTLVHRMLLDEWPTFAQNWVQRDSMKSAGRVLTPEQIAPLAARLAVPSYDQVVYFFKFSRIDLLEGQHTGSAMRAHKMTAKRTNIGMEPFALVHADGWNTHFNAPHPVTGEYVTYEIWHFHDVATRYTTPFSIGLSESAEVILKGLEHCIRFGGVPAIWQTDSTGAVKNDKVQFDPVASLSARAGLTVVHPQTVGNSQANGIAENYNQMLDRESRVLTTYQNPKKMDSLAFKNVKKFTGQMVRAAAKGDLDARVLARNSAQAAGKGLLFESRAQMVEWLEEVRVRGNNTPHSALPKLRDPITHKMRHQTPQECLDLAISQGWRPAAMDEPSLIELFRPHFRKFVRRETVTPFGDQRYHHPDLGDYNDQEVMVAVDTMDGARVWVKDLHGRLLFEATFLADTGYHSQSMYEFAQTKRMQAQIKRKTDGIERIQNRMDPQRSPVEVLAYETEQEQVLQFAMRQTQEAERINTLGATDVQDVETIAQRLERDLMQRAEDDERQRLEEQGDGEDRLFNLYLQEEQMRHRQELAEQAELKAAQRAV
jgi:putative transposase